MTKAQALVAAVRREVGVTEANNPERVNEYRRCVDGRASGESWCCGLVWFCSREVGRPEIFLTEHVATLWDRSPHELRIKTPEPGCLAVYYDKTNPMLGHVEIVTEILDETKQLQVGGNTSPAKIMDRAGRGCWEKERARSPSMGSLMLRGYLRVWADPNAEETFGPAF